MKNQFERLDLKKIIASISTKNRHLLRKVYIFDSIESTNTYLLDQLTLKAESGWVCLAEQQTRGRGRQGKKWFSPLGANIYCSLSWCFPKRFQRLSALSVATAAMVIKAVQKMAPREKLGLKWPNDIMIAGRKLAGILLENRMSLTENRIVIGIGLNLCLPSEKRNQWVGLNEVSEEKVSRNEMVGVLLNELLSGIPVFEREGLQPFWALCREHDVLLGQEIILCLPLSRYVGKAAGINEEGELMVREEKGQERCFAYGEVSVVQKAD